MKKRSTPGLPPPTRPSAESGPRCLTMNLQATQSVPRRGARHPDRTDIERPIERLCLSIETASHDAVAGGVEAPESLAEEKKASPFE